MTITSNADLAAMQREARRKRVLENAESRLRKIAGHVEVESPKSVKSEPCSVKNETSSAAEIDFECKTTPEEATKTEPLCFDTAPVQKVQGTENEPISLCATILAQRLHYVSLAVAVYCILSFNYGHFINENILYPFCSLKAIEFVMQKHGSEEAQANILYGALILCGVPATALKIFKKLSSIVSSVVSDFSLYFFTFVLMMEISPIYLINKETK